MGNSVSRALSKWSPLYLFSIFSEEERERYLLNMSNTLVPERMECHFSSPPDLFQLLLGSVCWTTTSLLSLPCHPISGSCCATGTGTFSCLNLLSFPSHDTYTSWSVHPNLELVATRYALGQPTLACSTIRLRFMPRLTYLPDLTFVPRDLATRRLSGESRWAETHLSRN